MTSTSPTQAPLAAETNVLRPLLWRLHFWAGLLVSPIILFAALTGLLYVFTPQIEAWRHGALDQVQPAGSPLPLEQQIEAALQAAPDSSLRFVVPGHRPTDSTQVYLRAPHQHHAAPPKGGDHDHGLPSGSIAYINPYTGQVLGQLPEMARFKTWAKKLHSSALQGNGWRWLIELGASWMLVLYASGLALWWPKSQARGGPGWRALRPRLGRGRTTWRDAHTLLALALGAVMAVVLVTGLTWSRHSGERFRQLQQALNQEAPKIASNLKSWPGTGPVLSWQQVWQQARSQAPDIAMQITPPQGADGVWRIENFDRSQPTGRFSLALDARSGAPLFQSDWTDLPVLSQATAVGIPFHRGEFGGWNQALLALTALAAVFSVVSGWVLWWKRRPRGQWAPPPLHWMQVRQAPAGLWLLLAALAYAMPVFGWSVLLWIALETALALMQRYRKLAPS